MCQEAHSVGRMHEQALVMMMDQDFRRQQHYSGLLKKCQNF